MRGMGVQCVPGCGHGCAMCVCVCVQCVHTMCVICDVSLVVGVQHMQKQIPGAYGSQDSNIELIVCATYEWLQVGLVHRARLPARPLAR